MPDSILLSPLLTSSISLFTINTKKHTNASSWPPFPDTPFIGSSSQRLSTCTDPKGPVFHTQGILETKQAKGLKSHAKKERTLLLTQKAVFNEQNKSRTGDTRPGAGFHENCGHMLAEGTISTVSPGVSAEGGVTSHGLDAGHPLLCLCPDPPVEGPQEGRHALS